jgi:glycosyltransferase involved in cell wall biosynthesis
MKVWYLSAYDQPNGQSTRTHDYSRELVRLGHEVTIFTNGFCHFTHTERLLPGELWRVDFFNGIRVVWLKTRAYSGNGAGRGLNMLDNVLQILQVSKVLGDLPDVVLGPSVPTFTGWAAARLAERYRVPFVFEVRDVWPDALVDIGGLSKVNPLYHIFRYVEKMLYRKAERISSVLPYLSEHVASSGSDPAKIVYLPNGVYLSNYTRDVYYDCGEGRQLVVMYVGGFGLDHDVPTIIRAAKILQDAGDTTFRFIVIGGGVQRVTCEEQVRSYGLLNLELRKPIAKSDVADAQRGADILVAAITDSKSFRFGLNLNKLCGYFASARPILFSGNSPNDPVKESGAGLSIAAEDPDAMVVGLKELASVGAAVRGEMGERGRRYAETTLSMEALGERMEKMLASAIKHYKVRPKAGFSVF